MPGDEDRGPTMWLFLLLGWRGRRGRRVGSPSREQVGLPADHSLGHSSVDRAPESMTSWHLFPHSLSPEVLIPGSLSNWVYSFHSYSTSQLHFSSLMCFPSSFSATVINPNAPSLKCQSKLHRDLRRTIVCLYAQSINLNYQLSHYMPTIKQWHTHTDYTPHEYSCTRDLRGWVVLDSPVFQIAEGLPLGRTGHLGEDRASGGGDASIQITFDNDFLKYNLSFSAFSNSTIRYNLTVSWDSAMSIHCCDKQPDKKNKTHSSSS